MQNGRVEVVDVHSAFDHAVAHFVGFAKGEAPFDSTSRHPGSETLGLVFAAASLDGRGAVQILAPRRPTKLATPQHQRVLKQAPRFGIPKQSTQKTL
jgi:hypothetical protein